MSENHGFRLVLTGGTPASSWRGRLFAFIVLSRPSPTVHRVRRSARDLWSGSFLLSWLTRSAMSPVLENPGLGDDAFLMPFQPSLVWDRCLKAGGELPAAGLPNRFLATIPADPEGKMALTLAEQCKSSCRNASMEICERVRQGFDEKMGARALTADWDRLWNSQVDTFFEIQAASLPLRSCDQATLSHLLSEQEFDPKRPSCQWWGALNLMARLLEVQRAEGYVPAYRAAGHVPQKCTLLGTYEQMGPAAFDDSNVFWRALASGHGTGHESVPWNDCAREPDQAIRMASVLSRGTPSRTAGQFLSDTATIAAALWLAEGDFAIDPRDELENSERWSGQWLHWATLDRPSGKRNEDEQQKYDPPPTQNQGNRIRAKPPAQGPPPAYYAILVLDGDRMGSWLRGEKPRCWAKRVDPRHQQGPGPFRDADRPSGGQEALGNPDLRGRRRCAGGFTHPHGPGMCPGTEPAIHLELERDAGPIWRRLAGHQWRDRGRPLQGRLEIRPGPGT